MDYPSNSNSQKKTPAEEKNVQQIISSGVSFKKKTLGRRFSELFLSGRTMQEICRDVLFEVLIPSGQDMIIQAGEEALHQTFGKGTGRSGRRSTSSRPSTMAGTIVSYNSMSTKPSGETKMSMQGRKLHDFTEIVFDQRVKAREVLDNMNLFLEKFDVVTVADIYDMIGVTKSTQDSNWGWTSLADAEVRPRGGGYILDLPPTQSLK